MSKAHISNIRGTYNLETGYGLHLWENVRIRLTSMRYPFGEMKRIAEVEERYGEPVITLPRLGQGSFRVMVTDVYNRKCAITQEKVLPSLDAAHIKPYSEGGAHKIENGILLRSDIHKLFDTGYVAVSPDYHYKINTLEVCPHQCPIRQQRNKVEKNNQIQSNNYLIFQL